MCLASEKRGFVSASRFSIRPNSLDPTPIIIIERGRFDACTISSTVVYKS